MAVLNFNVADSFPSGACGSLGCNSVASPPRGRPWRLSPWRVLKNRLKKEGIETVTICNAFKLPAKDGKMRLTPIADQEQLFRLIQSIPSPKAEPFKVWIATVASDRLDEMQNPELTIERAMTDYRRLGYSEAWINQRLKSIEVRKELTDEWKRCGVTTQQYASLTDIVTMAWSGKSTRSYKALKGLTKQNLRDNMTNVELALNTLAEAATTELSKEINPTTYRENVTVARKGGGVAKVAREQLEQQLRTFFAIKRKIFYICRNAQCYG